MANATETFEHTLIPTLQRVRALISLLFGMLGDPKRLCDFNRLYQETERLLARCMFEAAARIAGRSDLLDTYEAYLSGCCRLEIRAKPDALHPHYRIIFNRERAALIAFYRRALGRRSRFSRKISYLHFRNQRRRHSVIIARRSAGCAPPSHTPARISAPP